MISRRAFLLGATAPLLLGALPAAAQESCGAESDVVALADYVLANRSKLPKLQNRRSGAIAAMSEAEVRAAVINYGAGAHPISLTELCAIYADSTVDFRCEIKPGVDGRPYENFVPRVVETLARHGMLERTTFSSFLVESQNALSAATSRPRLWLVSPPVLRQLGPAAVIELAKSRGIPEIGVHVDTADSVLMAEVEAAGLDFGCWAAHSARQIEKLLALGVKVFTTDRPSLAIAIRNRFRAEAEL